MNRAQRRAKYRELRKATQLYHAGRITKARLDEIAAGLGFINKKALEKADSTPNWLFGLQLLINPARAWRAFKLWRSARAHA